MSAGCATAIDLAATGFVYFIQQGTDGPVKIGWTKQLERRLSELQTANPVALRVVLALAGDKKLERFLHDIFAPFRAHGEWFAPDLSLLEFIKTQQDAQPSIAATIASSVLARRGDGWFSL